MISTTTTPSSLLSKIATAARYALDELRPRSNGGPSIFLLAALVLTANAGAVDKTWNVNSGNFNVSGNWSGGLPTALDNALIDNGGISLLPSAVSGNVNQIDVGVSATGFLSISGGSLTNSDGVLALNAGSGGTATITSGTWNNTNALYIGFGGSGTMNINGGSVSDVGSYVGRSAGSTGTV